LTHTACKKELKKKKNDEMYAGINIFVCGDFCQLPPIGAAVMYSTPLTRETPTS